MSYDSKIPYMDKFAVMDSAKGEGLGSAVWKKMRESNSQLFWRSKSSNPINKFYMDTNIMKNRTMKNKAMLRSHFQEHIISIVKNEEFIIEHIKKIENC